MYRGKRKDKSLRVFGTCLILLALYSVFRFPSPPQSAQPQPPDEPLPAFYYDDKQLENYTDSRLVDTALIQRKIWDRQNPVDCARANFLRVTPKLGTLDEVVHELGTLLAFAMNRGYVLTIADGSLSHWATPACGRNGLECYFMPVTRCELDANSSVTEIGAGNLNDETPIFHRVGGDLRSWWEAQAAAYFLRMNDEYAWHIRARRYEMTPAEYTVVVSRHALHTVQDALAFVPRDATVFLASDNSFVLDVMQTAFGERLKWVPREPQETARAALESDFLELMMSLESTRFVGPKGCLQDLLRHVWSAPGGGCCTPLKIL